MITRTTPFLMSLLFLAVSTPPASAQNDKTSSEKWSPECRSALETAPSAAPPAVYAELRDTWKLVAIPVLKRVCGENAIIHTSLGLVHDQAGKPCFIFTARGATKARTRRPAHESSRARTVPLRKVEMRIYLHRPEMLEQKHGDRFDLHYAISSGIPLVEIQFAGDRSVRRTRGDGNADAVDWSLGDHYLRVEANSSSGGADALNVASILQNACNRSEWYEFPGVLLVSPAVPPPAAKEDPNTPPVTVNPIVRPAGDIGDSPTDSYVNVRLTTSLGDIVVALNETRAPLTVANFLQYVDDEFYDGTIFHRVMSGFMIQGGGMDPNLNKKTNRAPILNEWRNNLKNARGAIAMARIGGDPNSATSQFFINVVKNESLDRPQGDGAAYTVFGKVIEGMEVVDKIRFRPVGRRNSMQNVPLETILIQKVRREISPPRPLRDP